jgi:NAD(P)-dependent dehydrogenase (short-subunit alcohol dehydrogenase family)
MSNENGSLAGRTILIAGAGGGLGSAATLALAAEGARLVLLDKSVRGLEKAHDEIVAAGYPQPALYPLDMSEASEADYDELARILEETFGGLHGLLHAAADLGILSPLSDVGAADWEKALRVNLTAAHLLTRAMMPLLAQTGDAVAVFVSDSSARRGHAYWGAYGIAKIALEALARQWAEELASAERVRVLTFVPGPVNSPLRRKSHPGELPGENPDPRALAGHFAYLFGPRSRGMNGRLVEGGAPIPS